jgi:type VI protein secretion system component VasF
MSADLQKAIAEARAEVAQREDLAALVAAVLQQLPAAAPAAPACGCQHQHHAPAAHRSAVRPLAIGGAVVVGGAVLTSMFLAVALASVAVAIGALVAFLLVREVRKGGAR